MSGPSRIFARTAVALALSVPILALVFPPDPPPARAMNRHELAKVLRTIPPNGPPELYGNTILRPRGDAQMEPAVFPHWLHRARYSCRVCHLELKFSLRQGETGISRSKNLAGKYCGACHDGNTAFSVRNGQPSHCHRCHTRDFGPLRERFMEFSAGLPEAEFGNGIDWAEALSRGDIELQDHLRAGRSTMTLPEKLRKPLNLGTTAPRSGVPFSHQDHMEWLDCSNCHPDIFDIQKKGTEFFTMDKNIYGWFCGTCHMRTAFPMNDCHRCHPGMMNRGRF